MVATVLLLAAFVACRQVAPTGNAPETDLKTFLDDVDTTLLRLSNEANQAGWVACDLHHPRYPGHLRARGPRRYQAAVTDYAKQAVRFRAGTGHAEERRQLTVLKNTITVAAPSDAKESAELAQLVVSMAERLRAWEILRRRQGHRRGLPRHRRDHRDPGSQPRRSPPAGSLGGLAHHLAADEEGATQRFVELSNKGAAELGFPDTGAMWQSRYDMSPADFAKEIDRLWEQVPSSVPLASHPRTSEAAREVRRRGPGGGANPRASARQHLGAGLVERLQSGGAAVRRAHRSARRRAQAQADLRHGHGAIRRALLHLARPRRAAGDILGALHVHQAARSRRRLSRERVERELQRRSAHQDVHRSTAEDLVTIHHELGHNYYQHDYASADPLQDGANDGFHEGIGDTIALIVTPDYLDKVGLLDRAPDATGDTLQMKERSKSSRSSRSEW